MDLKLVAILWIIKFIVRLYDVVTLPIYFVLQRPWRRWKQDRTKWGQLLREEDPYSPVMRVQHENNIDYKHIENLKTMDDAFRMAVERYGDRDCMGFRDTTCESVEYHKNGKVLKKVSLGGYEWFTYNQVNDRVDNLAKGMLEIGIQPRSRVLIFAETRMEWMLACQACIRNNVTVVTMYATLGEEGITHGINEIEATHIITSQDLLPKLKKITDKTPTVSHIVYMESFPAGPLQVPTFPENVAIFSFSSVEDMGRTCNTIFRPDPPTPEDIAFIVYTSGSTGVPKGVKLLHRNMVAGIHCVTFSMPTLDPSTDVSINYLPLAHLMEIMFESQMLVTGVRIGYGSPNTLSSKAPGIMTGCTGDILELKPTLMVAVPLMLDKIRKGILEAIGEKSILAQKVFKFAMDYKLSWHKMGYTTPILNRLIFKKFRDGFGGNLKHVLTGSAPISPDTQDFMRMCLDVNIIQAYAASETCLGGTMMDKKDYSAGRIGAPMSRCYVRLHDWTEGNYSPTDKPYPRGELVVGGDCISAGYFKKDDLTAESFKTENGINWFYTGDIAELHPDGVLKIIDRKKDIVKLPNGKYIALGKIEAELKTCPLVDNICVVGNGLKSYLVALVAPNFVHLRILASTLNREFLSDRDMCLNPGINAAVLKAITEQGLNNKLSKAEIPTKITLCHQEWTPESGLLTVALKLRRKHIENHFKEDIEEMFDETKYDVIQTHM